jgi:Type I phosphodiesterase / nucleotide pyrophosphatase
MKKSTPIIVGILICIVVLGVSYFWATGLMDSVYAYRSPLHNSPPLPGEAIGNPNTRSFVVVLIDALRYDTSQKTSVMPYLNLLRSEGASALMQSRPPSYSEPGYAVLLTGAWPDLSDGPVINVAYADIPTFTQDDIFSAAHRHGLLTAVSGFNWFEKLIPQQAVSVSFYTAGEDQVADRQVTDAALPWLREGRYQLALIHLDQVDYAGHHEGGPIDDGMKLRLERMDYLKRLQQPWILPKILCWSSVTMGRLTGEVMGDRMQLSCWSHLSWLVRG